VYTHGYPTAGMTDSGP